MTREPRRNRKRRGRARPMRLRGHRPVTPPAPPRLDHDDGGCDSVFAGAPSIRIRRVGRSRESKSGVLRVGIRGSVRVHAGRGATVLHAETGRSTVLVTIAGAGRCDKSCGRRFPCPAIYSRRASGPRRAGSNRAIQALCPRLARRPNMLVRLAMVLSTGASGKEAGSSSFPGVGASVQLPIP